MSEDISGVICTPSVKRTVQTHDVKNSLRL